jgi:SAM-dependent methyltransferase
MANCLIPAELRAGGILDIGCGTTPYFLAHTSFGRRVGIDKSVDGTGSPELRLHSLDLRQKTDLPFETGEFSVVTMLAAVEHLDPEVALRLFLECYRVIKPGGALVITTPSPWAHGLLRWMSIYNLVSREEIEDHRFVYSIPVLSWFFGRAGFDMGTIQFGRFEIGLNLWARAFR